MSEKQRPTDWQLERLAHGELSADEARALEQRLGKEQLQARLEALAASDQEILARLPPETVSAAIRRRLPARRSRTRYLMALLPLAAAAGIWTVAAPRVAMQPTDELILAKGASQLLAYRVQSGKTPARLTPSARVRAHDLLQLTYTAGPARFGMVVSIDGGGGVTQHLPLDGATPVALAGTGEVGLPRSYELDDSPGFERFFFITAPRPFSGAQVLEAARALARNAGEARQQPLSVDPALTQESLLLEKVKQP